MSGGDNSSVDGSGGLVGLEHVKGNGVDELRLRVRGGGDQERTVPVEVDAVDAILVQRLPQHLLPSLCIVLDHETVIESGYDMLIADGPSHRGHLGEVVNEDLLVRYMQSLGGATT